MEFTEINKLKELLDNATIPYGSDTYNIGKYPLHRVWVPHPKVEDVTLVSVIQGESSYGGKENKLEIMGLLTPQEKAFDAVAGYLTADEVFNRIKKAYEVKE